MPSGRFTPDLQPCGWPVDAFGVGLKMAGSFAGSFALATLLLLPGCRPVARGAATPAATPSPAPKSTVDTRALGRARFAPFLDDFVEQEHAFVPLQPFARESHAWICANRSETAWSVDLTDGEVEFLGVDRGRVHRDPLPLKVDAATFERAQMERRLVHPVSDGWIIALSSVESGGEVWWVSRDGSRSEMIEGKHVVGFVNSAHGLLAALGQSYVTAEYGELVRFRPGAEGWAVDTMVDLGEVPRAMAVDHDGSILVVTPRNLLRVQPGDRLTHRLHHGKWIEMVPNSVTVDDYGVVHIGMRHAVVRLEPKNSTYKETWLVPSDCTRLEPGEDGEPCQCHGRDDDPLADASEF